MAEPHEHLDDEATIYPTHTCFDDVTEYLNEIAKGGASTEELLAYTVVHGITVAPSGERFAHAWLEHGDEIIEGGIYKGERVWLTMTRAEFAALHSIIDETRYTLPECTALEDRHGLPPWKPEYRDLCSDERRTWIAAQAKGKEAGPCER